MRVSRSLVGLRLVASGELGCVGPQARRQELQPAKRRTNRASGCGVFHHPEAWTEGGSAWVM